MISGVIPFGGDCQVPIGGDCQINKMLNKLKSMQKSNKFKASLSSFEEIRMLDIKLNKTPARR